MWVWRLALIFFCPLLPLHVALFRGCVKRLTISQRERGFAYLPKKPLSTASFKRTFLRRPMFSELLAPCWKIVVVLDMRRLATVSMGWNIRISKMPLVALPMMYGRGSLPFFPPGGLIVAWRGVLLGLYYLCRKQEGGDRRVSNVDDGVELIKKVRFRLGVYSVHWILAVCHWHPLASHSSTGRGRDIISNATI